MLFCCECFFVVFYNCDKNNNEACILHESVKKQISIFHSEKGLFNFIVTANYHICYILLFLNSIDVECFLPSLRKKKTICGFWQTFFQSNEMEVVSRLLTINIYLQNDMCKINNLKVLICKSNKYLYILIVEKP